MQNTLVPEMNNTDSIEIIEVTKSTMPYIDKLNNDQYENFILYNIAKNYYPLDVSINRLSIPFELSFNNTNLKVYNPDQNDLKNHIIINNNDEHIQSEAFAMNIKYAMKTDPIDEVISRYAIIGPNVLIDSNIKLKPETQSYFDSNIKIDVSLNNDVQSTTDGKWRATIDRRYNNMNYFSAINSNLNTENNQYPFYISEDLSTNAFSLGNCDGKYFTQSGSDQRTVHNFTDISNTLQHNKLKCEINTGYSIFDGSEFKTYRIDQVVDSSNISLLIQNESNSLYLNKGLKLPIGTNKGEDIYDNLIDFYDISKNINKLDASNSQFIADGFTGRVSVAAGGGYTVSNASGYLDINDNELTTNGENNLNYFNNYKHRGLHYIDISNGFVKLDSVNPNSAFVTLSSGAETLDASFCNKPGKIYFKVTDKQNRVNFFEDLSSDLVTPTGVKTSLTDKVEVIYNAIESGAQGFSVLSNELAMASDVSYNIKVIVESTANNDAVTYHQSDLRNLAVNSQRPFSNDVQDTRLVIANDNKPINFNIRNGTSFTMIEDDPNNKIRDANKITILNIKNQNNLVEEGQLCSGLDSSGIDISYSTVVTGSSCSVSLTDSDISKLKYSDYRVILRTKTAADISNSIITTNNWSFGLSKYENDRFKLSADISGHLIGNPSRVSELIKDTAAFLNGTDTIPIKYTFNVEPITSSINSIKYTFDACLNDPTNNYSQSSAYKFGGNNDVTFEYEIDLSDTLLANNLTVTGSGIYSNKTDEYRFERWVRRKQYKAQINPSFPFYENLLIKTNDLYEEAVFYRGWKIDTNIEVTTNILNNFSINIDGTNVLLSRVNVRLVEKFMNNVKTDGTDTTSTSLSAAPSTDIVLKPSDCFILRANLQGRDLSDNKWSDLGYDASNNVWNTTRGDIDPFIKQTGSITNFDTSDGAAILTCNVGVIIPIYHYITNKEYFIDITNPIGTETITADLYSFNYNDITDSLAEYFDNNFSPYNNTFSGTLLSNYKKNIQYNCDLSLNNGEYKLKISHLNGDQSFDDVEVKFPKDYVLNFNIINAPKNLIAIKRTLDGQVSRTYDFNTREGSSRSIKVDNGVHMELVNDITYGMKESFALKKDEVNVQFVDNKDATYPKNGDFYLNNSPFWSELSGNLTTSKFDLKYKPILVKDTVVLNNADSNQTKSVTLKRVRGYNVSLGNQELEIKRQSAKYTFVLDVSFSYQYHPDLSNGLPVLRNKTDGSLKYYSDISYSQYRTGDLSNNYEVHQIFDASSQYLHDDKLKLLDPSYSEVYEKQIYKQEFQSGVSQYVVNNLVSQNNTNISGTYWLENKVTDGKVYLDIGLIINAQKSVFADDDEQSKIIQVNTSAASYSYEFKNPNDLLINNGTGSGTLNEPALFNFFNFKTRSLKSKFPFKITLYYTSSILRVYSSPRYDLNPTTISNWEELPTSPFLQNQTGINQRFSLHPTVIPPSDSNGAIPNYNISLYRTETNVEEFTAYLVIAPPSIAVRFNKLNSGINSFPFSLSDNHSKTVHVDLKTNTPKFNLMEYVDSIQELPNPVQITGNPVSLYSLQNVTNTSKSEFKIDGNYMKLSLFSGFNRPPQITNFVTAWIDVSSNVYIADTAKNNTDVSFQYQVFLDASNVPIDSNIFNGVINDLVNVNGKLSIKKNTTKPFYDISYSQPIDSFYEEDDNFIPNSNYNINFTIDNAFVPPNTSYLPLRANRSTNVTFYESNYHYLDGKYVLFLNKYSLDSGTDYNILLANNTNIRQLSFPVNKKEQKAIELVTWDNSGGRTLINPSKLKDINEMNRLLDNITVNDVSGSWTTSLDINTNQKLGISLASRDAYGTIGLRNLFMYNFAENVDNKTLFIRRNDIFKVKSAFGASIFRITNSGNIVTPKVTTAMLSLFQQAVTINSLDITSAFTPGLLTAGSIDPSGNQLTTSNSEYTLPN